MAPPPLSPPFKLLAPPNLPIHPQLRTPPDRLAVPFLPPHKLLLVVPPRFTPTSFLVSSPQTPITSLVSPDYLKLPFLPAPKLVPVAPPKTPALPKLLAPPKFLLPLERSLKWPPKNHLQFPLTSNCSYPKLNSPFKRVLY